MAILYIYILLMQDEFLLTSIHTPLVLWCWAGLWIASHSRLHINGPSEPGRLRDVCVCQWVNYVLFYLHLTQCIYSTRSQFNSRWVFVVSYIKIRGCSKSPPPESTHALTRLIMGCDIILKVSWRLRTGWRASKMRWWSVSSCAVGTEFTGVCK